jgi:periplasmic divalent cation tolerance protein
MKAQLTLVTCRNARQGESIARALVEERLAACVNVVPKISSIYRWKGRICRDAECLLVIKSTASKAAKLTARVKELHSYTVPEVIHLPIASGNADYLDWIGESTT